jgi:predicted CXXCH cytochrome family protein
VTKRALAPILAFVLIAAGAAVLYSSQWTSYHDFGSQCLDCHISKPSSESDPVTFSKNINLMCASCHKSEQELSHPVGMKPSMKVPQSMPLDWKGELTCLTCHTVHKQGFGGFHLRTTATGEGFCVMCHGDMDEELHKVSVGSAHIGETSTQSSVGWEDPYEGLDKLSIKCLACHDAVTANDSLVENLSIRREIFHNSNSIGVSHPIGVSYFETRRKYRGAYRPVEKLPKEIKLFDGIVGCATCHNPYSKRHDELVMSNEGSALCLGCHVK